MYLTCKCGQQFNVGERRFSKKLKCRYSLMRPIHKDKGCKKCKGITTTLEFNKKFQIN